MEIPCEGKYVCKLNGPLVIYEASTGSLCGAVPCVMVDSGFTFKHTLVLVKADGTIQTKTTTTRPWNVTTFWANQLQSTFWGLLAGLFMAFTRRR